MYAHGLLAPMTALIGWSLVMLIWLGCTRLPAMRRLGIRPETGKFAGATNAVMPDRPRQVADNYNHLMEQPTLFFAICIVLQWLGQGDHPINIGFAWGYVALRIAHSLVQATFNHVPTRFALFALSSLLLLGLTLHAALGMAHH